MANHNCKCGDNCTCDPCNCDKIEESDNIPPVTVIGHRGGFTGGWTNWNLGRGEAYTPSSEIPEGGGGKENNDKERKENCLAAHPSDPAAQKKIRHALTFSGGIIPGLTDAQTRAFAANVAQTESAGTFDLSVENQFGYLGLYQFGVIALVDIGYINRAKYDAAVKKYGRRLSSGADAAIHKAFLADKSNWTIKGGKDTYLKDRAIQDKAFIALVNKNLSYAGKAAKAAFNGNPQKTVKYLKMAHLIGAADAAKGIVNPSYDKKDGNGTSMQKYGQGAVRDFDQYTKTVEKAQKCPNK